MTPAVSVVMTVRNGERFVRDAVESVLAQTLRDLELIVVDDGSSDSTPDILAEYAASDPRVVVCRQAGQGRPVALNRGFGRARADLVASLDADDVALPSRLECQRRYLAEHPGAAAVGGAVVFVDDGGRPFGRWRYPLSDSEIRSAFLETTPLAHPAMMVRKEAFDGVGGYRAAFHTSHDVDLLLRISERYELANVPDEVICYRVHAGQLTVQHHELQTLGSVAAHLAARRRREGRPDPLDAVDRIDRATLLGLGVTAEEITSAYVRNLVWLAKLTGRAGYRERSDELFSEAEATARSGSGSRELVAHVHRMRYRLLREQRRRHAAIVERARVARTSWRGRIR